MKRILLIGLLAIVMPISRLAAANNDQIPDTIYWNGEKYVLYIAWDVPSVLETYYIQSGEQSPFTTWKTNLTRGHIAYYQFNEFNGKVMLLLDSVEAKNFKTRMGNLWTEGGIDTTAVPAYFKIGSPFEETLSPVIDLNPTNITKVHTMQMGNSVAADWFSGVLMLQLVAPPKSPKAKTEEAKGIRYIEVVRGCMVRNVLVTENDKKQMKKLEEIPADNESLIAKKAIMDTYKDYRNYYLRCTMDAEEVLFDGHVGRFEQGEMPLAMGLWDNQPIVTPYSWIRDTCGPMFGHWLIRNDSIFLTSIDVHVGSEYYDYEAFPLHNTAIFVMPWKLPMLATWLSGDYAVLYGAVDSNSFSVQTYMVYKTQKIRVKDGVITRTDWSPRSFEEDAVQTTVSICNTAEVYSVEDDQLVEAVGKFKSPKKAPTYEGGLPMLRNYLANKKIQDERMKDRIFRVKIAFMVNCQGEVGNWQVISKGKGELFEFANIVEGVVKTLPGKWEPAKDKKGKPVDCWQYIVLTVKSGSLTNCAYGEE
ncbi:MAG: hypothetical protein K5864_00880 [Bacteroidales bacterium]|nr:hypothetical protein [Bacteroidales bacterium]